MKRIAPSLAAFGLSSLFLAALAPTARASTVPIQYNLQTSGTISFTTPANLVGTNNSLEFLFAPGGAFAPAELTASNFNYSADWSPDTNSLIANANTDLKGHLSYTLDSNNQISSISLYNNGTPSTVTVPTIFGIPIGPPTVTSPSDGLKTTTQTTSSVTIPFSNVGQTASFNLNYYDPPATSDFSLLLGNTTLLSGTFDPNGVFTATTTAPGVTATILPLAPPPGGNAVPEPSSLALLGLGALPLLGIARRRAARA